MDPWVLAAAAAFVPAVAWLLFFYSRDRHEREPLRSVLIFFGMGAVLAVPLGLILIPLLVSPVVEALGIRTGDVVGLFLVFLLLAGIPEESIKAGVAAFRGRQEADLDEPADGMIYFTSVGLGFGALETVLYIIGTYVEAIPIYGEPLAFQGAFVGVAILRAFTSTVAHGLWSGIVGYYYARHRLKGEGGNWILPGIGTAAVLHALYNAFTQGAFLVSIAILIATAVLYFVFLGRALKESPHRHLLMPTGSGRRPADPTSPAA